MLQGPHSSFARDRPLIQLPFTNFSVGVVLLPLTGFIACIFVSLVYHFEDATYTHCQVSLKVSASGGIQIIKIIKLGGNIGTECDCTQLLYLPHVDNNGAQKPTGLECCNEMNMMHL